jgi:hypothetical protein
MAAGATTGIAGILHLVLASNGISRGLSLFTIFFIVAGIAQLFWIIPVVKRWGRKWYYVGIGGTMVLMILYIMTSLKSNYQWKSINNQRNWYSYGNFPSRFYNITVLIMLKQKTVHASQMDQLNYNLMNFYSIL